MTTPRSSGAIMRACCVWNPVVRLPESTQLGSYGPAYEGLFGDVARYFAALPEFPAPAQNAAK